MKEYIIGKEGYPTFEKAFSVAMQELLENEEVIFHIQGELNLTNPVTIENNNSLFNGRKVIFAGEEGSTISGGMKVTGFQHFRDNIYFVKLPFLNYTRNLYLDGKFAFRPSTEKVTAFAWDNAKGNCDFYKEGEKITGLVTTDRSLLSWSNIQDVEMIFDVGWTHHILPICDVKELNDGKVFIQPMEVPFEVSQKEMGVAIGGCPTRFENVFELLEKPGEWYFDRHEQVLYLALAAGDKPENHMVEVPLTEFLFCLCGTPEKKISNIEFCHLMFKNTSFLRPHFYGHSDLQAGFAREGSDAGMPKRPEPYELDTLKLPGTIRTIAANAITFKECKFTNLDSTALSFEYGAENCIVSDCEFYELGAGALQLGDVYSTRAHHPTDMRKVVKNITVDNSIVMKTGRDFYSTVAVLLGYVAECRIVHNEISDVPYTAVSVGWGWGNSDVSVGPYRPTPWTTPSVSCKNTISYNHIHHCMMTLYDGGAIYTLGAMEGTKIEGNVIHESGGYNGMGCTGLATTGYNVSSLGLEDGKQYAKCGPFPGGIYLDEGSRGIEVFNNVVYGATTPLFYHNQIDNGLSYVSFHDNVLNLRPEDENYPMEIQNNAGRKNAHF